MDRARRLVGNRMDSRMSSAAAITSRAKALALVGVAGPAASLPRILRRAADFTLAFRRLCAADADETADVKARGLSANRRACDGWATRWRSRLAVDGLEPNARVKSMWDANPFFHPAQPSRGASATP